MSEYLTLNASALSGAFLEALQAAADAKLADPATGHDLREFNSEIARAVRHVRAMRIVLWAEWAGNMDFPPWSVCVAALPGEAAPQ